MSHYNQQEIPVAHPQAPAAYPSQAQQGVAPPPMGYPTNDAPQASGSSIKTQSRGDGFWKGCCAALCCCCMLDACF